MVPKTIRSWSEAPLLINILPEEGGLSVDQSSVKGLNTVIKLLIVDI